MASIPFARKVSSDHNVSFPRSHSDREREPRRVHYSSSDSFKSANESIDSDEGPSERKTQKHDARIDIPVRLRGKAKQKKGRRQDESEPLLQEDEANDEPDEVFEDDESDETDRASTNSTKRFCSVVLFLLCLVAGLTLIISVHVKSDVAAREVKPKHFHYYKISLIGFFILFLIYKYHHNWSGTSSDEETEPLIPSHLLTGLAIFGVCYSAFQIVETIDFVKCSRNVMGLDKTYIVSNIFEIMFTFCQIWVFYRLSQRRKQICQFGDVFTMFTLAINLTLWAGYFCSGAVNHPDLKNVTWLRRYYYGLKEDVCKFNNTGNNSRKLHVQIMPEITPYQYTVAMEYSLLASALLLHVWLEIATPSAGEFDTTNRKWNVWRFGFIAGLFSLPLMGCVGVYSTVEYNSSNLAFLYAVQFVLMFFIFLGSSIGLWLFRKYYTRRTDTKALKVDLILLCCSMIGYVILDLFTIFASLAENMKTYQKDVFLVGLSSLGNLVCVSVLTAFVFASYFYEMRLCDEGTRAAKYVCQIASFCITVNFGFWAIRTYTFRSKDYFDLAGYQYFQPKAWFVITLISTPMVIFYHFHCAVCLIAIVAKSSVRDWRQYIQH